MIVIVGPTGIGKTTLSIALAKYLHTEIISGDSVQVYKDLNIGSAKVTKEEQEGITHHLIDVLEPTENFSVALYQQMVRDKIKEFEDKNLEPLIVGGTGLYIKSVLYDYNFEDTNRDYAFEQQFTNVSNEELFTLLQQQDYNASLNLHPNNRKRVLQALSRSRNNKVSENKNKDQKVYDFTMIALRLDRKTLYQRINNRVDQMIKDGLVEEVKSLYDRNIHSNAVMAIGYKELYKYFDGVYTLEEAIEKIKQHSRNLAKKQYTFFNNQFDCHWIDVNLDDFNQTISEVLQLLQNR